MMIAADDSSICQTQVNENQDRHDGQFKSQEIILLSTEQIDKITQDSHFRIGDVKRVSK
jgi:hypothetical protein